MMNYVTIFFSLQFKKVLKIVALQGHKCDGMWLPEILLKHFFLNHQHNLAFKTSGICVCFFKLVSKSALYQVLIWFYFPPSDDRVWSLDKLGEKHTRLLPHPGFVYTAQFHPRVESIVVTGGYDEVIRVWDLSVAEEHGMVGHWLIRCTW